MATKEKTTPKPKADAPKAEIFILAVRNRKKSIGIQWREGKDVYDVDFHEMPLPSFYKAIEALGPHVATLCELPAKDAEKITATGITCSEDGDNIRAVIVARKAIKRGNKLLNLTTSILSVWEDSENANATHMTNEEAKAVEKVIKEAEKYLAGERGQGQIDFEAGEDETPEKKETETKEEQLPFEPPAAAAQG